jgi:ketosteroid isomerase-like protein
MLVFLSAGAPQPKGGSTMPSATMQESSFQTVSSQDEAAILALIATLHKANHDKDATLFASQFAPNAAIFNLAPPLLHRGVDLPEKQAWFDSWETPVEIEPRDFQVTVSGGFAFCHGFLHMSGTKRGAERQVSFWMRETLCLERFSGSWRIVHEHTSVPFYMDATLRPAFDLNP